MYIDQVFIQLRLVLIWETLTLFIEATVFVHLCFLFPYLIYSNGISRIPIDLQI